MKAILATVTIILARVICGHQIRSRVWVVANALDHVTLEVEDSGVDFVPKLFTYHRNSTQLELPMHVSQYAQTRLNITHLAPGSHYSLLWCASNCGNAVRNRLYFHTLPLPATNVSCEAVDARKVNVGYSIRAPNVNHRVEVKIFAHARSGTKPIWEQTFLGNYGRYNFPAHLPYDVDDAFVVVTVFNGHIASKWSHLAQAECRRAVAKPRLHSLSCNPIFCIVQVAFSAELELSDVTHRHRHGTLKHRPVHKERDDDDSQTTIYTFKLTTWWNNGECSYIEFRTHQGYLYSELVSVALVNHVEPGIFTLAGKCSSRPGISANLDVANRRIFRASVNETSCRPLYFDKTVSDLLFEDSCIKPGSQLHVTFTSLLVSCIGREIRENKFVKQVEFTKRPLPPKNFRACLTSDGEVRFSCEVDAIALEVMLEYSLTNQSSNAHSVAMKQSAGGKYTVELPRSRNAKVFASALAVVGPCISPRIDKTFVIATLDYCDD